MKQPHGELTLQQNADHALAFKGTPYENGFYFDKLGYCFKLEDKSKPLNCNIHTRTQLQWHKEKGYNFFSFFCVNCFRDGYDQ